MLEQSAVSATVEAGRPTSVPRGAPGQPPRGVQRTAEDTREADDAESGEPDREEWTHDERISRTRARRPRRPSMGERPGAPRSEPQVCHSPLVEERAGRL